MRAGKLRERVWLQKATETQAITGEASRTWATYETCHAQFIDPSSREVLQNAQTSGELSMIAKLRWFPGVTEEHRILAPIEKTTLNGGINNAVTSLTVASADPVTFSASGTRRILIDSELLEVTAGHGTTTLTVTRGADGTTPASHSNGATVEVMHMYQISGTPQVNDRRSEMLIPCTETT